MTLLEIQYYGENIYDPKVGDMVHPSRLSFEDWKQSLEDRKLKEEGGYKFYLGEKKGNKS
jgi:hypothetical protein